MARPVVGNPFENQIPTVSPTASPVDIYVRGTEKRSAMAGLADTLKRFSQKAVPVLGGLEQQAAEREILEGQKLYTENRIAIGEAVKNGIIEEGASPYIRKGYRISQMASLSMRYADDLERALEVQKLYHDGDPSKIETFISKFQQDFVNANGLTQFGKAEMQEYFGTAANKANEVFRTSWSNKHVDWQKEAAQTEFENQVAMATMTLMQEDASLEERQKALQNLGSYIEMLAKGKKVDGVENEDVIDAVMNGVGTIAEFTGDDSILDIFDNFKFGTDTASNSLKIQDKILEIENKVYTIQERKRVAAEREINEANETVRATGGQSVFEFLQDPTEVTRKLAEDAIVAMQATGVEKNVDEAFQLNGLLQTYDKNLDGSKKTGETEVDLDYALSRAKTEAAARTVVEAYATQQKIGSSDIFTKLNYWRQNYDPANEKAVGLDFNANTTEAQYANAFANSIKGNPDQYDEQRLVNAQFGYTQFKKFYRQAVSKWSAQNNNAFPDEQTKEEIGAKITRLLIEKYRISGAEGSEGLYPRNLPDITSLD